MRKVGCMTSILVKRKRERETKKDIGGSHQRRCHAI